MEIRDLNFSSILQVKGMDGSDCATKVEKAVRRLPGVIDATLVFPSGRLNLNYDPSKIGVEQVVKQVGALGYEARETEEYMVESTEGPDLTTLIIRGLDCADCAAKLERRVQAIPGAEGVRMNFMASRLYVSPDAPVSDILSAVEALGYSGEVEGSRAAVTSAFAPWETNRYLIPTIVSGVLMAVATAVKLLGVTGPAAPTIYTLAIVLGGYLPAKNGLAMLVHARELDMNVLMVLAVVGAVGIGHFEEGAMVVFLFSLGNALQGYTLDKTRNSIQALMELAPREALVRRDGHELVLAVDDIRIGDIVIVRPGERIPMDGRVVEGVSAVNQAPITGESLPVDKQAGDEVYAGTINQQGALELEVTRLAGDNTISQVIHMVEEAQAKQAPSQQLVDRFARWYTPAVILAAMLVAVVPVLGFNQPFHKWFYQALAMLLVACPCALVISTPVSIVSGIGSAARNGVLIKGGAYLEETGAVAVVAFDKTGTLTRGEPEVMQVIPFNDRSQEEVLVAAAAIESRSEHPLGEAIVRFTRDSALEIPMVTSFQAMPGRGAMAEVEGKLNFIGSLRFFAEQGIPLGAAEEEAERLQNQGQTVMALGDEERVHGLIAVADVLRPDSGNTIKKLKEAGIEKVVMLTGDNDKTAAAIARQVGVDEFRSELLPEDKMDAVQNLLAEYHKVAMVGDGINDAPALASSTVGIAMGAAGTDTALETADIALMADDLAKLPYTIRLSRKTLRIIKQNIVLSLAIKAAILSLVIPGWLTLWLAVVGDMGSSLLVTLNGMRLLRVNHKE